MLSQAWLLLLAALALAGLLHRQPLVVAVAVLLLVAGVLPPAWARVSLRAVRYRRRLVPERVFPDEPVQVITQLENNKWLPVSWLRVQDESPEAATWEQGLQGPSHRPRRKLLLQFLSVGWFQRVTRRYQVRLPRRGLYDFGPVRLAASDAFGLVESEAEASEVTQLVVYPRLLDPPQLEQLWRQPGGEHRRRLSLLDDPTRLAGVRDYRSGDPWRRIHWPATARLGHLQVKRFEPAIRPGTAIFLNLRTHPNPWDGYHAGWQEASISLAASLYRAELEAGRPVGLFANGHMAHWGYGPVQPLTADPNQLLPLLEGLARLLPTSSSDMAQIIQRQLPTLAQGTALLLVTTLMTPPLLAALTEATDHGHPVQVGWTGDRAPPARSPGVDLVTVPWQEVL